MKKTSTQDNTLSKKEQEALSLFKSAILAFDPDKEGIESLVSMIRSLNLSTGLCRVFHKKGLKLFFERVEEINSRLADARKESLDLTLTIVNLKEEIQRLNYALIRDSQSNYRAPATENVEFKCSACNKIAHVIQIKIPSFPGKTYGFACSNCGQKLKWGDSNGVVSAHPDI